MHTVKFFVVPVCLILLAAPVSFAGKIYKWVDKNGVNHFTNNPTTIPHEYRSFVEESKSKSQSGAIIEKIEKGSKNAFDEVVKLLSENREKVQVAVPLIAVLIALVYLLRGYLRLKRQREGKRRFWALELANIDNINNTEFEDYVGRILTYRGFKVEKTGDSLNFGVNFIAQKNNLRYAVQIVQKTGLISRVAVSDADREKHRYGCHRAMLITNGYFAPDAIELSVSKGCDLVDRDALANWIADFQKSNDK
jgi:HJR/Mrr/RecB family endonuclease